MRGFAGHGKPHAPGLAAGAGSGIGIARFQQLEFGIGVNRPFGMAV